ncbi:MAG: 50S ribosomal protein L4 [Candidatus Omnitrophica bacterium]|nr:50S ribosomal protein L4 [Candidatus Omnitrophota bacterium]
MQTLPVINAEGKEIDTIKLDETFFNGKINASVVYQAVINYNANQRKGLASTKTRGEVSGGGKKPWKQKGTGRARVGSIRSPLWRHGGIVFGPHPRDYSYLLPEKMRSAALKGALASKIHEGNLIVLDEFKIEGTKTKDALKVLAKFKFDPAKKNLLLIDKLDKNLIRVLKNIENIALDLAKNTNVYAVLSSKKVVITKAALKELTKRLEIK